METYCFESICFSRNFRDNGKCSIDWKPLLLLIWHPQFVDFFLHFHIRSINFLFYSQPSFPNDQIIEAFLFIFWLLHHLLRDIAFVTLFHNSILKSYSTRTVQSSISTAFTILSCFFCYTQYSLPYITWCSFMTRSVYP